MPRFRLLSVATVALVAALPSVLSGQVHPEVLEAYYRAVGDHFRVSAQEVRNLSEWRLEPDEVPVVLFLAERGGISADALVALRRGGRGWGELAMRYDVGADDFHVPVSAAAAGPLSGTYERYASTPPGAWPTMPLSDDEVVGLVNLRVLSAATGASPARVLEARTRTGSYVAAFGSLLRGG